MSDSFKPSEEEQKIISRLRAAPSFPKLLEYLQRRVEKHKDRLVHSDPALVPPIQGRVRELQDIIEILTKEAI